MPKTSSPAKRISAYRYSPRNGARMREMMLLSRCDSRESKIQNPKLALERSEGSKIESTGQGLEQLLPAVRFGEAATHGQAIGRGIRPLGVQRGVRDAVRGEIGQRGANQ